MCGSIVEDMALTGKALDVNAALRAACGAAKMLALSEGVVCPYTINNEQFGNQCPPPFDSKLPKTDNFEEMQRTYVFLRAVQQGIQPPIHIARLPEAEEKEFIREIDNVSEAFDALPNKNDLDFVDYFFLNLFKIAPTEETKNTIVGNFEKFISLNGNSGTPLLAFDCQKKQDTFDGQLRRIIGYLKLGSIYTQQFLENYKASFEFVKDSGFEPAAPVTIHATKDMNKIIIKIVEDKDNINIPAITSISPLTIDESVLDNLYYIQLIKGANVPYPKTFGILNIRTQSVVKYMFDHNLVVDVQPYLMYLLQIDKWAYENIMASSFGGNMIPPVKYPLAYYIIAHYVANRPPYTNPVDFYNLPIKPNNEKLPIMLAALKANSAELKQRIMDGYVWLKKDKAPSISELILWLGGGAVNVAGHKARKAVSTVADFFRRRFTRSQGGGKRVTRKNVRFALASPL
jgi:hypothetical protein